MINFLLPQLQAQAILLTPNQRLAATLKRQYNQEQVRLGQVCWSSATILPLGTWIQELWNHTSARDMDANWLALSADQELVLWEEIISAEPESEALLKLSDLAKQAKSAWANLKLWRCDHHHPAFALTENARHFQTWADRFEQRCLQEGWLDSIGVTERVIEKIRQQEIELPKQLVLVNFTEVAPLYRDLLAACGEQGTVIEEQEQNRAKWAFHLGLPDAETEIQTMAQWAKGILDQQPDARIGCISANLEDKREFILSALNEVFASPDAYNISAGRTLGSYPVIQQALELLSLPTKSVDATAVSALLHSPFLGDSENEMLKRVQFDRHLRRRNLTTQSWSEFLKEANDNHCGKLSKRLQAFLDKKATQPNQQSMSEWLTHFALLLETLGWPGEQSLNSTEYQVVGRWLDLLLDASTLDTVLPKLSYSRALHYLSVLVSKTYFQPESPEAPVQILGQLEGAGLPFDYLWVLGLDDTTWPPPPSPNPLIPQELQKTLSMPNASAERQLAYSRRMTQQYCDAAPQVFFSYAERNEKEELRPSPLIASLELKHSADLKLAPLKETMKNIFRSKNSEQIRDEQAAPLAEGEALRGGKGIFEMQALCPFKAFATLRLGARALDEPEAGLPPSARGNVVHKALELFWQEVRDQQTLLKFSQEELEEKVQMVLGKALQESAHFISPKTRYYHLLCQRLKALLLNWLELEKKRPSFTVVALEQPQEIRIENYTLTLRVDRVDEVAGGNKLIIDYKTREECKSKHWFGERPEEPQLPLYCLTQQHAVDGLAFGVVHSKNIEMVGLSRSDLGIANIKPLTEKTKADATTWEGQLEAWRINLRQLFHDFQSGKAAVDPLNPNQTCRHCDLQTLCRIHEDPDYSHEETDS